LSWARSSLVGLSPHRASPTYPPATPSWRDRAEAAADAKDFAQAKRWFNQWLEASPADSASWYNLACVEAQLGEKDAALNALDRAVASGFNEAAHAKVDPDLESIRSDPRFAQSLDRIAQIAAENTPPDLVRRFAEMKTVGTYVVLLPPDYQTSGKDYPLCVALHGRGGDELSVARRMDKLGR